MLGRLLNRLLVPEWKRPIVVPWSRPPGDEYSIEHDGLFVFVEIGITNQQFTLNIELQNNTDKTVAIGTAGVGLLLRYADGKNQLTPCKGLKHRGQIHEVLTIGPHEDCTMSARFDAAPLPQRVDAAIQVNRFLAAPYLFTFPIETEWDEEVKAYARLADSPFRDLTIATSTTGS